VGGTGINGGGTCCHTHHALRQNTLSTTATLGDLNCQQVLDNVARFVAQPDALPSLAVVNNGSVLVTDQSSLAGAADDLALATDRRVSDSQPVLYADCYA